MTQTIKNLPAMQETQVWSLGREDPLDKGMVTHSNILVWRIPWTEESGRTVKHNLVIKQQQRCKKWNFFQEALNCSMISTYLVTNSDKWSRASKLMLHFQNKQANKWQTQSFCMRSSYFGLTMNVCHFQTPKSKARPRRNHGTNSNALKYYYHYHLKWKTE